LLHCCTCCTSYQPASCANTFLHSDTCDTSRRARRETARPLGRRGSISTTTDRRHYRCRPKPCR
jgi:hypothetical protein